jgi:serine/threonine protein kinase
LAPLVVLSPGQILDGKYQIVRELGRGAMGIVYQAMHMALGRRIAIKTLLGETHADPELVARFEREARAASAIGHPHIVDVFDLGRTSEGLLFMAMEFLDGPLLSTLLAQRSHLPVEHAIDLTRQILGGLAAAHKHGVVHRDLKPDNIFVLDSEERPNFVKIVDFGIAKIFAQAVGGARGAARGGTMVGTVLGTPLYMPPEQILGQVGNIDHRADIYSVGVVLYEMLCGRPPFLGRNQGELFSSILDGHFPSPRELRSEIPVQVESALVCALDRDMNKRFASAAAMRAALTGNDRDDTPSPDVAAELLALPTLQTEALGGSLEALPEVGPRPLGRELKHSQAQPQPSPALELERPAREREVRKTSRPVAPAKPEPARARPRLGKLLVLLAAVAAVAGGAVMVLRSHTRNQTTPVPRAKHRVTLAIDPAEAVVSIDHLPAEREELAFEPGTVHTVEATAPGRIACKRSFEASAALELTLRLGRTLDLPSLATPEPLASELTLRDASRPASRDEIHRAFAKLDRYAKCLTLLGYGEGDTRKSSLAALPNNGVLSACIQATEEANAVAPALAPLQAAAASYLRGASEREMGSLGRLLTAFRAQYLATRAGWQREELARQEADEGATAAWHMRRVALAAQTWFRASRGGGSSARAAKEARVRLEEYQAALLALARRSPQELERISGAKEFLKAVEEVVALAQTPSARRVDPGAAKTAVQALVVAFNALVV